LKIAVNRVSIIIIHNSFLIFLVRANSTNYTFEAATRLNQ